MRAAAPALDAVIGSLDHLKKGTARQKGDLVVTDGETTQSS